MCGTGDINVQDFKAHAVIVGGSWHFREKVCHGNSPSVFSSNSRPAIENVGFMFCTGDEVVLGRGVQLHSGGVGPSAAVHHRILSASPGGIQHPLPLFSDHRCSHTQHLAHCTHVVSRTTDKYSVFFFYFWKIKT